jgi:hypothetical protein
MHACIVVSLMAGVRPEETRTIGWEQDVDLVGSPASVAVLRADRPGGDTKTGGPTAPQLAQMAVGRSESDRRTRRLSGRRPRCRAGDRPGIHHRRQYAAGARHVRKMFQDVCERAGLGRDWAPRDLRHTLVSLLSDDGMAIKKIARLVGHVSSQPLRQEAATSACDSA